MNEPPLPHLTGNKPGKLIQAVWNKFVALFYFVMSIISAATALLVWKELWGSDIGSPWFPLLFVTVLGGGSIYLFWCGMKSWTRKPVTEAGKHE